MSNTVESVGIAAGKTAAYGGAATAAVSGMTLSELGIVIGAIVGVLGLILGQYWARRRDDRQRAERAERQAEHELRMSLMRASGRPVYRHDTDFGRLEATNE